jgi:hypothetical protein
MKYMQWERSGFRSFGMIYSISFLRKIHNRTNQCLFYDGTQRYGVPEPLFTVTHQMNIINSELSCCQGVSTGLFLVTKERHWA